MINFSAIGADTRVGRLLRYPLRLLPSNMVVPVLQGPLRGARWIVGSHVHGCWLGTYELAMQRTIAREVNRRGVFFDIGANVGFYSLLASTLVSPALVCAFEPLPANVHYLQRHLALNHVTNVKVFELAISDQSAAALFNVEGTRAMGRLAPNGTLKVETRSIDMLVADQSVPPPAYIKMDIEGGEVRALRGAQRCLKQHGPKLFLAVHGREAHQECCALLQRSGYSLEYIARDAEERAELLAVPRT